MQRIGMQANHIRLISVKPDYAKLSMDIAKEALNGFGCIHDGALFGLADTTAGVAAFALLKNVCLPSYCGGTNNVYIIR